MKENLRKFTALHKMENCADSIKAELLCLSRYEDAEKDIIIVVHNQLDYIKNCIKSIEENTENYNIFIWDNSSDQETKDYLKSLRHMVVRNEENIGFIRPNNRLFELGVAPYVILLNSDTEVKPNWDKALISWLQQNENTAQTGYMGGLLDEELKGGIFDFGSNVDYICGWATCIRRNLLDGYFDRLSADKNKFFASEFDEEPFLKLFDEKNLEFAYAEDADLSLRIKEHGLEIYALHLDLVNHFENKTVKTVVDKVDLKRTFSKNHEYMRKRWSKFDKLLRNKELR